MPLPQLDRVAIGIADLRARIVGSLHRPPSDVDTIFPEKLQCDIHIVYLEREALPAEPLLRA